MSDSVENKIVSIQFDNAAFKAKMDETIRALDNLRRSLDFSTSKKSLDDLNTAGKHFSLGTVDTSIKNVSAGFLSLATIGITALSHITSAAISSGTQLVRSFSFGPIFDGFHEFETNANSIQTILANTASKGTTLSQVTAALDKLNEFSDKTIFNFSEMARNIGTFTAAGIDLDSSVNAIKGIANLSAMSGSSAEQASALMYQLSQAMASGTLKAQDWISVVNAGVGGEAFKSALFESAKALKTIKNVPLTETFTEWVKKGGNFKDAMADGVFTADVLRTTLEGFTGDLTKNQLVARGFSEEQAANIMKTAKIANAAATEVKTFTQLIGTVKEAIGTGWADTFRLILGNFDEAKTLFTGINNVVSGFVQKQAAARNAILKTWKDFGGRKAAIEGVVNIFKTLAKLFNTVKAAFRDIFPRLTGERLLTMTAAFRDFAQKIKIGADTLAKIRSVFRGFFAGLSIGFTIIKEFDKLIISLLGALAPAGSAALDFGAKTGDFMTNLQRALVAGGGIHDFFVKLGDVIRKPIVFVQQLATSIHDFFSKPISAGDNRVTSRIDEIRKTAQGVESFWDRFSKRIQGIKNVLSDILDYITNWFSELGHKIAEAFHPGDFDPAVDLINVGLLTGIVVLLRKFLKNGLKIDVGNGLIDKIKGSFDALTGTLKAMQAQLKAKALRNIAVAIALLTGSLVVLSLIDSKALTKALTAMTVAFGELIGSLTAIDKLNFSGGSVLKLQGVGTALIIISSAMVIFAAAVKIFSTMDTGELAKGLAGISAGLALLIGALKILEDNDGGLITAGVAMTAMAGALLILSAAVKAFGSMDLQTLAKGLGSVAIAMAIFVGAAKILEGNEGGLISAGIAMLPLAVALNILAGAVALFGTMDLSTLAKGIVGVSLALAGIGLALKLMPKTSIITGAGLILVATGMTILAEAVKIMGTMSLGDLAKGIGGIGAALLILALGTKAMNDSLAGAAALAIVSFALLNLSRVLVVLAGLSIAQLITGLVAIAAAMAVIGGVSFALQETIPFILGFGIALGVLGAAIALFGIGVNLIARSFEILAKSGKEGMKALGQMIGIMAASLVDIVHIISKSVIAFVEDLLNSFPLLVRLIEAFLDQLLETMIKEIPKLAQALVILIDGIITVIRAVFPDLVEVGFEMLMSLLKGVKDHIFEITNTAIDIMLTFVSALIKRMPDIVAAAANLIISFLTELSKHAAEIVSAGTNLLVNFLNGIAQNLGKIVTAVANIITKFIKSVGENSLRIINAGVDLLVNFIKGIADNLIKVTNAVGDLITRFVKAIGENSLKILNAGSTAIITFCNGLKDRGPKTIAAIAGAAAALAGSFVKEVAKAIVKFAGDVADAFISFLNGVADVIRQKSGPLGEALANVVEALVSGFKNALLSAFKKLARDELPGPLGSIVEKGLNLAFGINSPSKLAYGVGLGVAEGLRNGVVEGVDNYMPFITKNLSKTMSKTLSEVSDSMGDLEGLNPVITPVLDLTQVKSQANTIGDYFSIDKISPEGSFAQAKLIAALQAQQVDLASTTDTTPNQVIFEQTINAPSALSTSDIYRNTKSQIVMAKEKLGVS